MYNGKKEKIQLNLFFVGAFDVFYTIFYFMAILFLSVEARIESKAIF